MVEILWGPETQFRHVLAHCNHCRRHSNTVLRQVWTDSGMIKKLTSIGKLTLKVPEAEVI